MFMMIARNVSLRSTCPRLNVGAIIVHDNNIVSMGYNGSEPGEDHCTDIGCKMERGGCVRTTHAEVNALNRLPAHLRTLPLRLFVTHSPCGSCAERILRSGISAVYFEVPYRNVDPLNEMLTEGIAVYQITPSGHIIPQELPDNG